MTEPPYECPTRTTGLLTRLSVLFTLATSSACESSPCWLAITSCPSARRVGISLLKQEPSAHRPWTKTMLGLPWCVTVCSFAELGGETFVPRFPEQNRSPGARKRVKRG